MRNKCKHNKAVILLQAGIRGVRVEWCQDCGSTRYHDVVEWGEWYAKTWSAGKWKSPKIAIK